MHFDVFNGDADGICGLHQYRMANPCDARLISGVKRDVNLLARVSGGIGDQVTVFDVSLQSNRAEVDRLLVSGARVRYFDHHEAGELPVSDLFAAHIDTAADVCTSVIVDRLVDGRYRDWAVAAAFGDNLPRTALALAARAGLDSERQHVLQSLGECLNYNGYGDSIGDLFFDPVELYRAVSHHESPFDFVARAPEFQTLADGLASDSDWLQGLRPAIDNDCCRIYILPGTAQARRASGTLANRVALEHPEQAHAVLTPNSRGTYTVSVRAPVTNPYRAQEVCRQFGGGGRHAAAGVNDLTEQLVGRFVEAMTSAFGSGR